MDNCRGRNRRPRCGETSILGGTASKKGTLEEILTLVHLVDQPFLMRDSAPTISE